MSFTVDTDLRGLTARLNMLRQFTHRSLADMAKEHARLVALDMAGRTQPFSVGNVQGAKKQGEEAVANDIRKLYKDMDGLLEMVRNWKSSPWQRALVKALESEDWNGVAALIDESYLLGRLVDAPDFSVHQKYRNSRGRVRSRGFFEIVRKKESLLAYIRSRQLWVGWAKSVWWTIAQKINVTSLKDPAAGFPAWVKRHNAPGSIQDYTNDPTYPYVIMRTELGWMTRVLEQRHITRGLWIVEDKMLQRLKSIWRAEFRNQARKQAA